jgi:hypothetical protein
MQMWPVPLPIKSILAGYTVQVKTGTQGMPNYLDLILYFEFLEDNSKSLDVPTITDLVKEMHVTTGPFYIVVVVVRNNQSTTPLTPLPDPDTFDSNLDITTYSGRDGRIYFDKDSISRALPKLKELLNAGLRTKIVTDDMFKIAIAQIPTMPEAARAPVEQKVAQQLTQPTSKT